MLAQTLRDRTGPLVGLLRQRAPGLDRIDQLGSEVHRLQQRVCNLRPVGQGPVAHPVQQILAGMHHPLQRLELEQAAVALEGVDLAEQVVEQFGVVRGLLDIKQTLADALEALARLQDELLQEFGRVHALTPCMRPAAMRRAVTPSPISSAAVSTRSRGRAGLIR